MQLLVESDYRNYLQSIADTKKWHWQFFLVLRRLLSYFYFMTLWLSQENLTAKHYKAVTIFSITEPFLSLYQWSLPGWQCPPSVETRCQLYDEYENDVKHLLWPSQSARSQPNWSILEKHVQLYQRGLSFTFSKVIDYSCKVIVVVRCSVV